MSRSLSVISNASSLLGSDASSFVTEEQIPIHSPSGIKKLFGLKHLKNNRKIKRLKESIYSLDGDPESEENRNFIKKVNREIKRIEADNLANESVIKYLPDDIANEKDFDDTSNIGGAKWTLPKLPGFFSKVNPQKMPSPIASAPKVNPQKMPSPIVNTAPKVNPQKMPSPIVNTAPKENILRLPEDFGTDEYIKRVVTWLEIEGGGGTRWQYFYVDGYNEGCMGAPHLKIGTEKHALINEWHEKYTLRFDKLVREDVLISEYLANKYSSNPKENVFAGRNMLTPVPALDPLDTPFEYEVLCKLHYRDLPCGTKVRESFFKNVPLEELKKARGLIEYCPHYRDYRIENPPFGNEPGKDTFDEEIDFELRLRKGKDKGWFLGIDGRLFNIDPEIQGALESRRAAVGIGGKLFSNPELQGVLESRRAAIRPTGP